MNLSAAAGAIRVEHRSCIFIPRNGDNPRRVTQCEGPLRTYSVTEFGTEEDGSHWRALGYRVYLCDRHHSERLRRYEQENSPSSTFLVQALPHIVAVSGVLCTDSPDAERSIASPEHGENLSHVVLLLEPLVLEDGDVDEFVHSERRRGAPFHCRPVQVPAGIRQRAFVRVEPVSHAPVMVDGNECAPWAFVRDVQQARDPPGHIVTLTSVVLGLKLQPPGSQARAMGSPCGEDT